MSLIPMNSLTAAKSMFRIHIYKDKGVREGNPYAFLN